MRANACQSDLTTCVDRVCVWRKYSGYQMRQCDTQTELRILVCTNALCIRRGHHSNTEFPYLMCAVECRKRINFFHCEMSKSISWMKMLNIEKYFTRNLRMRHYPTSHDTFAISSFHGTLLFEFMENSAKPKRDRDDEWNSIKSSNKITIIFGRECALPLDIVCGDSARRWWCNGNTYLCVYEYLELKLNVSTINNSHHNDRLKKGTRNSCQKRREKETKIQNRKSNLHTEFNVNR